MTQLSMEYVRAAAKRAAIEARGMRGIKDALEKGDSLRYFQLCEEYGVPSENPVFYAHGAREAEDMEKDAAKGLELKASTPASASPVIKGGERTTKFNYSIFEREVTAYETKYGKINPHNHQYVGIMAALLKAAGYGYLTSGKEAPKTDAKNEPAKKDEVRKSLHVKIEEATPWRVSHVFMRQYEQMQKRKAN